MNTLVQALKSGSVLVMDGAMGTELMRRKRLRSPTSCEQFNIDEPELIRAIHQSYVDAGADVLLTNTFQANPIAIARTRCRIELAQVWRTAIELARSARPRFVLGDIGPMLDPKPRIIAALLKLCVGVDGILLETWASIAGPRRFAGAGLPLLASFAFQRGKKICTFDGFDPERCAEAAAKAGAAAIGANCGQDIGFDEMLRIVRRFRKACDLPMFVKLNAGAPPSRGWRYPRTPAKMGQGIEALLEAGVCMIGGCCGTTPEHVRRIRAAVDRWNRR